MARKFFALEEAEVVDSTDAGLDGAEVLELDDGVQETQVEAAEVDEIATAIEDAEVAAGNLEDAAGVLEAGVESGEGVSEETAQAVDIAVEAALNMLGASHRNSRLMPSLESWGSGSSRLSSTRIALEGVGDKIKEIWKKIVEFVKMVAQKVIDFFVKFFDNTERLKKAAAKMRSKVKEFGADAKIKDKEIKNGSVTKAFNNGEGKSDYDTARLSLGIMGTLAGAGGKLVQVASNTVNSVKNTPPSEALESLAKAMFDGIGGQTKADQNGDTLTITTPALLQGRKMRVVLTKPAAGAAGGVATVDFEIVEPEKKSTKEAATLTYDQALNLIKQVEDLALATEDFKKVKDKIGDLVKATSNLAQAALKSVDEDGSMAGQRKAVTSISRVTSRYVTMLPAWNVAAGKAALSYVASSMAAWEKPKAEEKK